MNYFEILSAYEKEELILFAIIQIFIIFKYYFVFINYDPLNLLIILLTFLLNILSLTIFKIFEV